MIVQIENEENEYKNLTREQLEEYAKEWGFQSLEISKSGVCALFYFDETDHLCHFKMTDWEDSEEILYWIESKVNEIRRPLEVLKGDPAKWSFA